MSIANYQSSNTQSSSSILPPPTSLLLPSIVPSLLLDSTETQKIDREDLSAENHIKVEHDDINEDEPFPQMIHPGLSGTHYSNHEPHYPSSPLPQDSDTKFLDNAFNPSSLLFNSCQESMQSPFRVPIQQQHVSPFIPFCRDHLSPLCPNDHNATHWFSKRVLFSPK